MIRTGKRLRISDVAAAAGVSVLTVSNVLNNGTGVRAETRGRVQAAICRLGYVPNPPAVALRKETKQVAPVLKERKITQRQDEGSENQPANSATTPQIAPDAWPEMSVNDKVGLLRKGHLEASGTVDALMPDHSTAWIVLDKGLGRIMVHAFENIQIRILAEHGPTQQKDH